MTFSGKNKNIKKVEDEVLVELNMKTRILNFIINGDDKIDAYNDIPVDKRLFFPVVILYDKDDSVKIIKC